MKIASSRIFYESPQLDSIEVEVEQGFNASGDPTITNPDMGWGDDE